MQSNKGFIRVIILVLAGILILSYFKIDLRGLANSDTTQGNFSYVWSFLEHVWYDYIKTPIVFLLNWVLHFVQ
ncbi:MAG: hypothetical protein HY225_00445 [Candidatus Vogelbacteria bacterium]|nr:hypothetical protein [Candidatus Vogelbacteria bacterium]